MSGAEEIIERTAHRLPPGETIGDGVYERLRRTPNRDAYVAAMMLEAGRLAYEAGRQDAAGEGTEAEKQLREWMLAFAAILWQHGGTLVLDDRALVEVERDARISRYRRGDATIYRLDMEHHGSPGNGEESGQ